MPEIGQFVGAFIKNIFVQDLSLSLSLSFMGHLWLMVERFPFQESIAHNLGSNCGRVDGKDNRFWAIAFSFNGICIRVDNEDISQFTDWLSYQVE